MKKKREEAERSKEHADWVCLFYKSFFYPELSVYTPLPEQCHRAATCCMNREEISWRLGQSTNNFYSHLEFLAEIPLLDPYFQVAA